MAINNLEEFEKRVAETGCSTAYRDDDSDKDFYRGLALGAFIISAAIATSLVYLYGEFGSVPAHDGCITAKSEMVRK